MASLYRSTALFILATSLFHVRGAEEPSSKKVRGTTPDCGEPPIVGLVKEVDEGLEVGPAVLEKVSPRDRMGESPLLMESIDVAGDIPSESMERRCCH
jgi:hypothetical protein